MTSFADDEISQASSVPADGYEFVGSATTWRYTSGVTPITIDGNVYTPLAGLRRSLVKVGGMQDTPELTVTLPIAATVVQHYVFATPPRSLTFNLYRYQATSGGFEQQWTGEVVGINPSGEMATMTIPSAFGSRLSTNVPSGTLRKTCAHFLFDDRCRVSAAAFDFGTTVSTVDDRTIVVASVDGHIDDYYRAGKIVRDSDGESRAIISQIGTTLLIASPFRTLAGTNPVTLYAGCDHTHTTCESKFSNLANFGGFPTMPIVNPFVAPLGGL